MEEKKYVKCKAKMNYRKHPSPKLDFDGGSAIINFYVIETLEGQIQTDYQDAAIFKGEMCRIDRNEVYTILAEEVEDETYGIQYDVIYIGQPADLSTTETQKIFLSKILTATQITNLYNTYNNPLQIILDEDVDKLCLVKGIGMSTAEKIIEKVVDSIDYSKAYVELDSFGLTKNMIEKLVDRYNSPEIAIKIIKDNPYKLIEDVDGIGFKKADEIALSNGFEENNPTRLLYLAQFVLESQAKEGNSWLDSYEFMDEVRELVDDLDEDVFYEIISKNHTIFYAFDNEETGDRCIALFKNYLLEMLIAEELIRIKNGKNEFDYGNWEDRIKQTENLQGWNYTEEQKEGIKGLVKNQLVVITGGAGVGKTSTVSAVTNILQQYIISQTALSGRAACRMSEITGEDGYTIHRLLNFNPQGEFDYNKDNPLDSDIVIVDEVSMIGGEIFYSLVQAIKTGSKLILLGDTGQLESIGKMNILHDCINSEIVPCYHLTKPHRQALKSGIIESSVKARHKEQLFDKDYDGAFVMGELEDCYFDITLNKYDIPNMIADYFEDLIIDNPIQEVQVIVPNTDRGQLSCEALNPMLQDIYNPLNGQDSIIIGDYELRIGDKVINRKNNYKTKNEDGTITPIFNGDIGIVTSIDKNARKIIINFDIKGKVVITKKHLINIKLGYCITTHSSQGSQYDHVIYGLDYGAYKLLNKEQVYTGITRAKKTCTVCAENKAFRKAVATSEINNKQTFLKDLLKLK